MLPFLFDELHMAWSDVSGSDVDVVVDDVGGVDDIGGSDAIANDGGGCDDDSAVAVIFLFIKEIKIVILI